MYIHTLICVKQCFVHTLNMVVVFGHLRAYYKKDIEILESVQIPVTKLFLQSLIS